MQTLGLHIEGKRLFSVALKSRRGKPEVSHFQILPVSEAPKHVKQFYIPSGAIATGLTTPEVVTREIRFNLRSRATLLTALPFQIESSVPFSPEETVAYTLFRKGKGKETFVSLFACKETSLDRHIEKWQALQADPSHLSCAPQALHRFAFHFFPSHHSLIVFHVGADHCTYLVLHERRLTLSGHISLGTSSFIEALNKDDPSLPNDLLDAIDISDKRTPHLYRVEQQFKQEIARLKTFLERKGVISLPTLLCGEIPTPLASILELQFENRLTSDAKEFSTLQPYAIPLGLALDAHYQDTSSVQFRQGEKASMRWRSRFKKMVAAYVSLCLLFALSFGSLKSFGLSAKKNRLEKKLSTVLHKEVTLQEGIAALEQATNKTPSSNSTSLAPKVSDVLQWIGSHPLLQKGKSPLEITSVQYKLEKYPKLGEKKEPYLAKVELEIFSTSPTAARDFHNALLKGDHLVDEKKGVIWKTSHNTYFTKFYLKNCRQ